MRPPGTSHAATHAARAAEAGWSVFPIRSGDKRRPPKGWPTIATDDRATVASWWADDGPSAFGIHIGRSRLLILDVDGDAGAASLAAAERDFGRLPATLTVGTPRGEHRYFADPGDIARRLAWRPGLDVLTGTHFIVGPGSALASGSYDALADFDSRDVPALPRTWTDALRGCAMEAAHTRVTIDPIPPQPNGEPGIAGEAGSAGISGDAGVSGVCEVFDQHPLERRHTSHRLIFTLARHTRALFPDDTRPPDDVLAELRRWWVAGQAHTERTWADALADFTDAWGRVDPERGLLAEALRAAQSTPTPTKVAQTLPDPQDAPARLLAALAAELDRRNGGRGFYLAQAEAARALGVHRSRVGGWLRMFQREGWLRLIEPGSYAERRANTYAWLLPD